MLREYQERALAGARQQYREGSRAILIVMPTGGGKTITAATFARNAIEKGRSVQWLAHRTELVAQARKTLLRLGARCEVDSVWTLARRPHKPADVVIWDEAHHCTAETFRTVQARYPEALHIGLTATPQRADGVALGNVFTSLVCPVSIPELIDGGFLVPSDVIAPAKRTKNPAQTTEQALAEYCADGPTIVFVETVDEARRLAREVPSCGYVSGDQSEAERDAAIKAFKRGETRILANVFVLTEGFDHPPTKNIILARGFGSVSTYLQCVGRGLRPSEGKKMCTIVDLYGCVHEHGMPDEEREYSLDGEGLSRKKPESLRRCVQCGAVDRPGKPTCTRCGYVFPPPELKPVRKSDIARVSPAQRKDHYDRWLHLHAVGVARGYKPGWAKVAFKEETGYWPSRKWEGAQ